MCLIQDQYQHLIESVQLNCHISDASHAGDYTLCTYLMKMRELFRWEQALDYGDSLDSDALGDWVREREGYWQEIDGKAFSAVQVNENSYRPFDQIKINTALEGSGLIYSGGLGYNAVPHFFLAQLDEKRLMNGHEIFISGKEFARDLTSPPAMSRNGSIYLRREAFRRLAWERIQEWRWNRADNAMGRALSRYDLDGDLEAALDQLTEDQIDVVLWHELGEIAAGEILSNEWEDLLIDVVGTPAELRLRTVRDNFADALSTLKLILKNPREEQLHFYFALLTPLRKKLQPGLLAAYQSWLDTESFSPLHEVVTISQQHWQGVAMECLEIRKNQTEVVKHICEIVDAAKL